jgi:hypothetical protein
MRSFRSFSLLTAIMVCGLVVAGARAQSQTPPAGAPPAGGRQGGGAAPQNLKVLPKDIARPALTAIMRGYTAALGVQCNHCHVEDMAQRASDENPKKDIARKMIKMTMDINSTYLAGVGDAALPDQPKVTCYTCHRGAVKPLTVAGSGH